MIKQATFEFLTELVANNNREWFNDNKARYDEAKENATVFAAEVIAELKAINPALSTDIDPKKCVGRIYWDIRFSPNKTPYKNNIGISKLLADTKAEGIEFYIHIQPGSSFAGGGYWMPEAAHLKAIRQEIDYNAGELKAIIDTPAFKKLFGEFRDQEQLKTLPRDYAADNENISLLKLKSFTAMHPLTDAELLKKDSPKKVAALLANIYPLTVFLNSAIV
jgi:uncharacterized protein (TIGR02453 family)